MGGRAGGLLAKTSRNIILKFRNHGAKIHIFINLLKIKRTFYRDGLCVE